MGEGLEESLGCFAVPIHLEVGQSEWPEEPSPHWALVVGRIALTGPAEVPPPVMGVTGRQAPEPARRRRY